MYCKLVKTGRPGWSRKFQSRDEVAATLSLYVCTDCQRIYGKDLDNMLRSSCGTEFYYIGPPDENKQPETEANLWAKLAGYEP